MTKLTIEAKQNECASRKTHAKIISVLLNAYASFQLFSIHPRLVQVFRPKYMYTFFVVENNYFAALPYSPLSQPHHHHYPTWYYVAFFLTHLHSNQFSYIVVFILFLKNDHFIQTKKKFIHRLFKTLKPTNFFLFFFLVCRTINI